MSSNRETRLQMLSVSTNSLFRKSQNNFSCSKTEPQTSKKDASTQTINRERDLDPINYSRLYISEAPGKDIHKKRELFYDDVQVNYNIRKRYYDFVNDNDGYDQWTKLQKVDKKYHLLDHTLNTNILKMSSQQLKKEFSEIGWSYLGLQARMEYEKDNCYPGSNDYENDSLFFKDAKVNGSLKLGYTRWKRDNRRESNSSNPIVIVKPSIYTSNDFVEVQNILPDSTLESNISDSTSAIDQQLFGLKARLEYGTDTPLHLGDLDFVLDEKIPLRLRTGYKQWLSSNMLHKHGDKLYVKKRDTL